MSAPRHFPRLDDAAHRARELFDIDIEASLTDWLRQLAGANGDNGNRPRSIHELELLDLTPAERRVISLTAAGYSSEEAARLVYLSPETIKSHRKRIHAKLRATNGNHAVTLALLIGELDVELLRAHVFRTWEGT